MDTSSGMTERLRVLKERYLKAVPSITIDRALAFTEIARKYPALSPQRRIARSFKRACETAPLLIQPGELIIGHPCGKARAGAFSPDIAWQWVKDELDDIGTRPQDPYEISDTDKEVMTRTLFPFWKGKSLSEHCKEALQHLKTLPPSDPGYDTRHEYYLGALDTYDGVLIYARRLARYARELAAKESDPQRRRELLGIADINERVPANPPRTFHEALQSVWTILSLFMLEGNQCSTSLSRADQYMYPLYKQDIETGRLSRQKAFELIGCFIIKCSEVIWYTPGATATYFAGYMPFINMCVGGVGRHGGDATNELTLLFMDAVARMKLYQPTLACRIHNMSPQEVSGKNHHRHPCRRRHAGLSF